MMDTTRLVGASASDAWREQERDKLVEMMAAAGEPPRTVDYCPVCYPFGIAVGGVHVRWIPCEDHK